MSTKYMYFYPHKFKPVTAEMYIYKLYMNFKLIQ
jgi:hypothetical protein